MENFIFLCIVNIQIDQKSWSLQQKNHKVVLFCLLTDIVSFFPKIFSCPKKIVIMRLFLLKNTFLNPVLHVLLEIHILRGEVILTTPFQQSNSRTLNFCVNDIFVTSQKLTSTSLRNSHCVKSVKTRSFFQSVFSRIRSEYGHLRSFWIYLDTFHTVSIKNIQKLSANNAFCFGYCYYGLQPM